MGLRRRFRQYVQPPTRQERQEILADITESVFPGFDFFLLAVLSCSIALLGPISNSRRRSSDWNGLPHGPRPAEFALAALPRAVSE